MNSADEQVKSYLKELDHYLSGLPRRRRREVIQEIQDHISESRIQLGPNHPVEDVLERVGDPKTIAMEAAVGEPASRPASRWMEVGAIIFLLPGSIVLPFVGWVVGVILLWASSIWTLRDKIIGTLVIPGGLLPAYLLAFGAGCSQMVINGHVVSDTCPGALVRWLLLGLWIFTIVGPIATGIYLGSRLRRNINAALLV